MTDFERLVLRALAVLIRLGISAIWSGESGGPELFAEAQALRKTLELTAMR